MSRSGKVYQLVQGGIFKPIGVDVFLDRIQRSIGEDKVIVVDEFHRLSEEFQDLLHALKPSTRAKMILITSSLFFSERILGKRNPLLGIVIPVRVDIFTPIEIIKVLKKHIKDPLTVLKTAIFAREPILLNLVEETSDYEKFLAGVIVGLKDVVPALIGEIFFEEGREITERYEAILKAIAVGNNTPAKIASYISGLLNRNLSSSDVKSYLRILGRMGIIGRLKIFRKKKFFYFIKSPMIQTYYYLSEKIGFGEVDVPLRVLVEETKKLIPKHFEMFIVELFAEILGGNVEKVLQDEIDGVITRKKVWA